VVAEEAAGEAWVVVARVGAAREGARVEARVVVEGEEGYCIAQRLR